MNTINAANSLIAAQQIGYIPSSVETEKTEKPDEGGEDFSQILQDAVRQFTSGSTGSAMSMNALTGSGMSGMQAGFPMGPMGAMMPSVNNSLEQMILKAAETGNGDDAMMALMMLMMMMESGSGSGGGDMSMMMPMMAAMIESVQGKENLRDNFMFTSGGQPYTLDAIDRQIFGNKVPNVTGTGQAELPLEWWRPTTPAIVSTAHNRSPQLYNAVIAQHNVETAERYKPGRAGNTYCNIYVWDVTRAMGAELPYYVDPATGAPREYPDTKGATSNGAIAMDKWLKEHGAKYGWHQVTAEQAQWHANQGRPVVTAADDVGHVQMVAPSKNGAYDPIKGVAIAQAGSKVGSYMHITDIYGAATLNNKVTYWAHA